MNRNTTERSGSLRRPASALKRAVFASPLRAIVALALFAGIAAFAVAQDTQPPTAQLHQSEYQRMLDGLRKARPVPAPAHAITPHAVTASEGLERFDPQTGKTSILQAPRFSADQLESLSGSTPAHPGAQLGSANGRISPSGRRVGQQETIALAPDFNANPTPPVTATQPYTFPFNTQYKLLMRFTVPNAVDQFFLCTANSVSDFHLLSAAHCVYNHDPLGDGSGRGAGYAKEIWAWPAQTDVVDPIDHTNWRDFPYGVAKMTMESAYSNWVNNSDFNWDFSFITLDRRIGDLTGWPAREWNVQGTTLATLGYASEAPFVPADTPFLYVGQDVNNVVAYTTNRIQMSALTYGGMSGGGVFRFDGSKNVLEGVNSTSNRHGSAFATRYMSQTETDLQNIKVLDSAIRKPADKTGLIEYQFNDASKALLTTSGKPGDSFSVQINALNAGFITEPNVTANVFLCASLTDLSTAKFVGLVNLGTLDSFHFLVQTHTFTIPQGIPPGAYYVGWVLQGTAPAYTDNHQVAMISKKQLTITAPVLSSVTISPSTVSGGTNATGAVILHSQAPAGGVTVTLTSSSPSIVIVPSSVTVKQGAILAQFPIVTNPTRVPISITITAAAQGSQASATLSVNPGAETTTASLASSLNPSTLGQNVTITGTVHGSIVTPTGTVKLMHGATQLAAAPLTGGVARFNIATLPVGVNALTLAYSGDLRHKALTSPVFNQKVLDTTAVTAVSSLNPSSAGQAVTFTATVKGQKIVPTGQVQLKRGSTVMATATLTAGKAAFKVTTLPQGTSAMLVSYLGDANHAARASAPINQVVKFTTATHLTSSTLSAAKGTRVTLTAKITPAATGTVTFKDGSTLLSKVTLGSSAASFAFVPAVGTHTITAVYSGDARNAASTSAAAVVKIH